MGEVKIHYHFANGLLGHRVEGTAALNKSKVQGVCVGETMDLDGIVWDRIALEDGTIVRANITRVFFPQAPILPYPEPIEAPEPLHPLQSELSIYLESNGWKRGLGTFFRHKDHPDFWGWEDKSTETFYFGHKNETMESVTDRAFHYHGGVDQALNYISDITNSNL